MTRYHPPDLSGFIPLNMAELTWVDTSGKLDVSDAAAGNLACISATYSPNARDMPFGYIPLFNANGSPHWDKYISMDFDLRYDGDPGDAAGGDVILFVGIVSDTTLASGAGYWAGVKWDSNRLDTSVAIASNGSVTATAGSGGVTAIANVIKGNISFSGSGIAEINALMESGSQNNNRTFQSHNDQMYLCIGIENAGSVAAFSGVRLNYRLNRA